MNASSDASGQAGRVGTGPTDSRNPQPRASQSSPSAIMTVSEALRAAEPRPLPDAKPTEKKNYAEQLSRHLATCFANGLRPRFPEIVPDPTGRFQESKARTDKGYKKLDVNYSTPELGLGLGVSIKTLNYRDTATKRYTKNYSRIDNELRAEATDYHHRQPYAVLIGVLFLPVDSCDDCGPGSDDASSFGAAVRYFRQRGARVSPKTDDEDRFEGFFVGLYDVATGEALFFDVSKPPPRNRRPTPAESLTYPALINEITRLYDLRNSPPFKWADP